jgi:peptidoglycan/xylan/chitin deacetylase (PgdA/CDA1 family)
MQAKLSGSKSVGMWAKERLPTTALFLGFTVTLLGCAGIGFPRVGHDTILLGRNDYYAVVLAGENDSFASLADRFFGDISKAWVIADANDIDRVTAGQEIVIPLSHTNVVGVYKNGYQTVPILSYHRFDNKGGKLSISPVRFETQMAYLKSNDYRVIPLSRLITFLQGIEPIPRRAVVITIDDGYRSAYDVAFPILRNYGFPATVFIYTDFIGKGGLTWQQLKEMKNSGLIDIQAHSKTHSNLTIQFERESDEDYRLRLSNEIKGPKEELEHGLDISVFGYAYPYGGVNTAVIKQLKQQGFKIGLTVEAGSNAFFTYPYALNRTMIYGHYDIQDFARVLKVFEPANL